MKENYTFKPYAPILFSEEEMKAKSKSFAEMMSERRSVRFFSDEEIPLEVIENIVTTANSAPSGANMQPWKFALIKNKELKKKIRSAAEKEEFLSYNGRMSEEWLTDLAPLDTNWEKEFLETAPYLIIMLKETYGLKEDGGKKKHYYVNESIGIAAGFLISAIHQAGLVTLTHTPSPMNFLTDLLERPSNEKAYLLLPVGLPSRDCVVPDINKKQLKDVLIEYF